jgi:DNA repair protein RadA/Sms
MAKNKSVHRCMACGAESLQWVGRCPGCEEWNTLVEEPVAPPAPSGAGGSVVTPDEPALPILEVDAARWVATPTGVGELDRVLGGGLVPGSVTLLGGEPGIGKSTLLTQVAAAMARRPGAPVLYVAAEESSQQVRLRAERLGGLVAGLWLASETSLPAIVGHLDAVRPAVVVIDSIQTIAEPALGSAPGSVAQVRECAARLVREAKARRMAVVLVGHVTKDGGLAGPRVLEHMVDTVLSFEGERHHALRLLRAVKHRFGDTTGLGLFEMSGGGLMGVPDPSGLFLADRRPGVPGSSVVATMDGSRPLLIEIQALVASTPAPQPRRSAQGLDSGRLALLLAVLEKRVGISFSQKDVFALAAGGVKVFDPGADLAMVLALASSSLDRPLPPGLFSCAEVGLGGELRQVPHTSRRLAEAARLGFREVLLPSSAPAAPPGLLTRRVDHVRDAIEAILPSSSSSRAAHPAAAGRKPALVRLDGDRGRRPPRPFRPGR